MTLIRHLGDEVRRGKYGAVEELASNLRECAARMAALPLSSANSADPDRPQLDRDWACDPDDVAMLRRDVESSLNTAARNGDASATIAYGELLKSDVLDAVAAMYRDRANGVDPTSSKLKFSENKIALTTYARSGLMDAQDAKELLSSVDQLELEP